jgi:hypothetical protein
MISRSLFTAGIQDFLASTTSARRGAGLPATEAALARARLAPRNGVLNTAAGAAVAEVDASAMDGYTFTLLEAGSGRAEWWSVDLPFCGGEPDVRY